MGAYLLWDNGASSLFFDVVTTETQSKSSTITEHPVETGADVTDHVRINLDRVTIEGFVSNTPVFAEAGVMTQIVLDPPQPPIPFTINGAINLLTSAIGNLFNPKQLVANVMTFGNGNSAPNFVRQTIAQLDQLRAQSTLLTVVCPHHIYNHMLIESYEVQRDAGAGTGASFTLELREIRTVQSSITQAPEPTINRGQPDVKKGSQAGIDATNKRSSALKKITG